MKRLLPLLLLISYQLVPATRVATEELAALSQVFDLPKNHFDKPVLVTAADGLGSKATLAQLTNRHDIIGKDLVTKCINDLVAQGAEPLFFIDHCAAQGYDIEQTTQRIAGIAAACKASGCELLASQSTDLPDIFQPNRSSTTGFAVGVADKQNLFAQHNGIKSGDVIIGLPTTGIHLSGYSTILSFINDLNMDIQAETPFASCYTTAADAFLEPATVYTHSVQSVTKKKLIKSAAHITHGGLSGSIERVLPAHLNAELDMHKWYVPPIFRWIKQVAKQSDTQMADTFNLGIGMAVITAKENATQAIKTLAAHGTRASIIGSIGARNNGDAVIVDGALGSSKLRVMVIGNGGREHAIAWKLGQSPFVELVCVAPGNSGTFEEKKIKNIRINPVHYNALITYAQQNNIDLVIVGPSAPVASGIVDEFIKNGIRCFGPTKKAAQIETSKIYAKEFMATHNIPTPEYRVCTTKEEAAACIQSNKFPLTIKADGLKAGQGVVIAHNEQEAVEAAENMIDAYGAAIIEQYIDGVSVSFMVISDGDTILPLPTCQQYHGIENGSSDSSGPSMGSCCPAPIITKELHDQIMLKIMEPAIKGLRAQGEPFAGFLYAGLIVTPEGGVKVLEFNCHLGECEAQSIMMRLQTDLFTLCNAAYNKQLDLIDLKWDKQPAVSVVLANGPAKHRSAQNSPIVGIPQKEQPGEKLFHMQTLQDGSKISPNGTQVLCATALGSSLIEARNNAYGLARQVYWPQMQYRQDIGYDAIAG